MKFASAAFAALLATQAVAAPPTTDPAIDSVTLPEAPAITLDDLSSMTGHSIELSTLIEAMLYLQTTNEAHAAEINDITILFDEDDDSDAYATFFR